jgi:hypothetical protein
MDVDYGTLKALRKTHPAWKLLVADHSPLIAAFLHKTFIVPNQRRHEPGGSGLGLEDLLFTLRETEGEDAFPRPLKPIWMTGPGRTRDGCGNSIPRDRMKCIMI